MRKRIWLSTSSLGLALGLLAASASAQPCRDDGSDTREVCRDRDMYMMPGVQGVVYDPAGSGVTPFAGAGVHFAPLQWSHNNDDFGPGQGAVFMNASLLRSQSSEATMALWEGGTTLSFERNASRHFLIPYFGATVGGITHAELPDAGYTYPLVGMHAVYHPHVMIDVEGGYLLPFKELDTLRGPRGELVMRFSMW